MDILSTTFGNDAVAEICVGALVFLLMYLTGFVLFQKWRRISMPTPVVHRTSFQVSAPRSRPWGSYFGCTPRTARRHLPKDKPAPRSRRRSFMARSRRDQCPF